MKRNFRTNFDPATRVFSKHYFGTLQPDDISKSWYIVMKAEEFPRGTKKFLISYEEADIDFSLDHLPTIMGFYSRYDDVFSGCYFAVVATKPNIVVFPVLAKLKGLNFEVQVFSTNEAAMKWLMAIT